MHDDHNWHRHIPHNSVWPWPLLLICAMTLACGITIALSCGSSESSPTDGSIPDDHGPAPDLPPDGPRPDAGIDAQLPADAGPDRGPLNWTIEVVDDEPKFKSRAALASGPDGDPRLTYNIASDPEGWYVPDVWFASQDQSGGWQRVEIADAAGQTSNEFPVVAVDSGGRTHIFFNRRPGAEPQVDVFHSWSDDLESFSDPANLTDTADQREYAAAVATDQQGGVHVLIQVEDKDNVPGVGYLQLADGKAAAVEQVAAASTELALNPDHSIAVAADGAVHAVYARPGSQPLTNVLYLRSRDPDGSWSDEQRLTPLDLEAWGPTTAVDGQGSLHLACVIGPQSEKTLTYYRWQAGKVVHNQSLTSASSDRSYYLGLAAEPDGTVHIAFTRFDQDSNADVFYLVGKGGKFLPEQQLTATPGMDEAAPAIALGKDGAVMVSFVENLSAAPAGKVFLATGLPQ